MTSKEQRIGELEAFAKEENIILPWPAAVIAEMEERGAVVDLITGLVIPNGAEQRVEATVVGEATVVANKRWGWL